MSEAVITIAALYVERGGVYWDLPGVDPWDEERDARKYGGPHPVVAHPPCNRWVNFAGHNYIRYTRERGKPQPHLRPGNDGGCFACALESIRKWGGVLEHPADSHAWSTFAMQRPCRGEWVRDQRYGLWVTEVSQSAYGHLARKRTWLAFCGPQPGPLDWSDPEGEAQIGKFDRAKPTIAGRAASTTPVPFRDLLTSMARSAGKCGGG